MFVKKPFEGITPELTEQIITETENALRDKLYKNKSWFIDYVRIRMRAVKTHDISD